MNPRLQHILGVALMALTLLWPTRPVAAQTTRPATPPVVDWKPGTRLVSGTTYRVPAGHVQGIVVNVDRVTLKGSAGNTWPGDSTTITVRRGVRGTVIEGFRVEPPQQLNGRGRFVQDEGIGTIVRDCYALNIRTGVNTMYADGTRVERCEFHLRGSAVFSGGSANVSIHDSVASSTNENTFRASPQSGRPSRRFTVTGCTVENRGGKAAVELRHVWGAAVVYNVKLKANPDHSAVGIGDKDASDGDPGSRDVYVIGNYIEGGAIVAHEGVNLVVVDGNHIHSPRLDKTILGPNGKPKWPDERPHNNFIRFNCAAGVLKDVRVTNNTGTSPVPQKEMVVFHDGVRPERLTEYGNAWTLTGPVTPAPAHN